MGRQRRDNKIVPAYIPFRRHELCDRSLPSHAQVYHDPVDASWQLQALFLAGGCPPGIVAEDALSPRQQTREWVIMGL